MLSKINKIERLGLVFSSFQPVTGLPEFKSVNLVYGWNGSGKTTLSRLFDQIASGSEADSEFEVTCAEGTKYKQGDAFPHTIRTFNQDYVQKNVSIVESRANAISIVLGEENKELIQEILTKERELNGDPADSEKIGKIKELDGYRQKLSRKEKGNDTAFTDIAKTIGAATVGGGVAARNYRRNEAERDFDDIDPKVELSAERLDQQLLSLKQDELPSLDLLQVGSVQFDGTEEELSSVFPALLSQAAELCASTVEVKIIEKLREHPDISSWVEDGVKIHKDHKSEACEFCGSPLTQERVSLLVSHFSAADQELKSKLDAVIGKLRSAYAAIAEIKPHDEARLYTELRKSYGSALETLEAAKTRLSEQITGLAELLKQKKMRTNEKVQLHEVPDLTTFLSTIQEVSDIVLLHNKKSAEFEQVRKDAVVAIKGHYLATIALDVNRRRKEIEELRPDLLRREAEIESLKEEIRVARSKISSTHRACEQINDALKTFLGRAELRFEPDEGSGDVATGYRIMRGNQPAKGLSEGEKTAIAFIYFTVHLADGQFQKANGIVVIDDPISSLDSNSLYQAFSFLKNAVAGCYQVFVFTHSFEFLRLLLNWRARFRGQTGYYMIRNAVDDKGRRAIICEMDKELQNYASEYQYLFKLLKQMQSEQDGTLVRAYPVPNIARKVWESFLAFRVPNSDNPYRKMEVLKEKGFDEKKLDAIYKFTNDQSHITGAGFDPALVPEAQKVLAEIFEMMEAIAPDHYAILNEAVVAA